MEHLLSHTPLLCCPFKLKIYFLLGKQFINKNVQQLNFKLNKLPYYMQVTAKVFGIFLLKDI